MIGRLSLAVKVAVGLGLRRCHGSAPPRPRPPPLELDFRSAGVRAYLERLADESETPPRLARALRERAGIVGDLDALADLCADSGDAEVDEERKRYEAQLADVHARIACMLTDIEAEHEQPHSECVLEVIAGVGGQEAMLFANELLHMYEGYATRRGWSCECLYKANAEGGGIRTGSVIIAGRGAHERLLPEAGVHRVQRIPTTEKSGRLHTSTVSVAIAHKPKEVQIELPDRDLRFETKRSSGAGGQHVNKTESCVRVTHVPTGITIECQEEREQYKNKRRAIERLKALLYKKKLDEIFEKEKKEKKAQIGNSLRNEKIRTYNFNQDRVTDHRLGSSTGTVHNISEVLEGGPLLDVLIDRLHVAERQERILNDIKILQQQKS